MQQVMHCYLPLPSNFAWNTVGTTHRDLPKGSELAASGKFRPARTHKRRSVCKGLTGIRSCSSPSEYSSM